MKMHTQGDYGTCSIYNHHLSSTDTIHVSVKVYAVHFWENTHPSSAFLGDKVDGGGRGYICIYLHMQPNIHHA